jgi:transcriptional regulator with XRE-family HTH domain
MLLQKRRLQLGWSQEQLADLSGVSVRTIQRLEQGKPAATETLKNLGAVLNVPFHDLRTSNMETTETYNDP